MDKYKYKRRQVRELQEDLDAMSRTYDNLSAEEATITGQVNMFSRLNLTMMGPVLVYCKGDKS